MKLQFIILLTPFLFSCSNNKKDDPGSDIPIHNYDEVSERFISWNDSLSLNNEHYYVYYFSRTCKYCDELKNEVIDIALNKCNALYFCNDNAIIIQDLDPIHTIGISDISNLYIRGFPSLIEVRNNTVTDHLLGKSKVITFLRNLTSGI